ncbi:hypothetical protein D4R52_00565 [bacterium]|nr:MAG: hypothetical protein D4R52_00565 [bacterium]
MLHTIASILFYMMMAAVALYSAVTVYVLLKFGKSKILAIVISLFYLVVMTSLYAAAVSNFEAIIFPNI